MVLGLDPGRYEPLFQAWDGILASGICEFGSYSVWMATTPYLRAPWRKEIVPYRCYEARVGFMRRWLSDLDAQRATW